MHTDKDIIINKLVESLTIVELHMLFIILYNSVIYACGIFMLRISE